MSSHVDPSALPKRYQRQIREQLGPVEVPESPAKPAPLVRQNHKGMNRLEAKFLVWLREEECVRERIYVKGIRLVIGNGVSYEPDFFCPVLRRDEQGNVESLATAWETKGEFVYDDAIVKLKVAAREHPWITFFIARLVKGRWDLQKILP